MVFRFEALVRLPALVRRTLPRQSLVPGLLHRVPVELWTLIAQRRRHVNFHLLIRLRRPKRVLPHFADPKLPQRRLLKMS